VSNSKKSNQNRSVRDIVIMWNNRFPLDVWWRQRHKIPFGSIEHRAASYVSMVFEFIEYAEFEMARIKSSPDWIDDSKLPDHLQLQDGKEVVRMTEAEIDHFFNSDIDIESIPKLMNIRRQIEISADSGNTETVFKGLGESLKQAFEQANDSIDKLIGNSEDFGEIIRARMSGIETSVSSVFSSLEEKAKRHTKNTQERVKFMEREIALTERQLNSETRRARLAEQMKYSSQLKDAETPEERSDVRAKHRAAVSTIDEQAKIQALQMRGLREQLEGYKEGEGGVEKDRKERGRNDAIVAGGGVVRQAGMGAAGALGLTGLLTVSGFVGKMLMEGVKLDEALSGTGGLGVKVRSATGLGKTTADMAEYARNISQQAGSNEYDYYGNLLFEKRFSSKKVPWQV
jgi:hypothetical protein